MVFNLITSLSAAGLLVAMLLLTDVGRRIGTARHARGADGEQGGFGAAEGAVLGLLGLVIAFTFDGAGDRLEHRRHLINEEANAIGTAYLRLDLLSGQAQTEMRALFRRYVDLRLTTHSEMADRALMSRRFEETNTLQADIWTKAVSASRQADATAHAPMLVLPAINAMFDIEATRAAATKDHPPPGIFLLLVVLGLVAAMLVGYAMARNPRRSWLHMFAFAGVVSISLFIILELEFPRFGFIGLDAADQTLVNLRRGMR